MSQACSRCLKHPRLCQLTSSIRLNLQDDLSFDPVKRTYETLCRMRTLCRSHASSVPVAPVHVSQTMFPRCLDIVLQQSPQGIFRALLLNHDQVLYIFYSPALRLHNRIRSTSTSYPLIDSYRRWPELSHSIQKSSEVPVVPFFLYLDPAARFPTSHQVVAARRDVGPAMSYHCHLAPSARCA